VAVLVLVHWHWGHGQAGPGWHLHAQLTVAALAGKHDATTAPLWREPDLRARAPPTIRQMLEAGQRTEPSWTPITPIAT
jgi:hypothetical protein